MRIGTLKIRGKSQEHPTGMSPSPELMKFEKSFMIEPSTRSAAPLESVTLNDTDVLELILEDGTIWFANCYTLDEVFPELTEQNRSGDGFILPVWVSPKEEQRGIFGKIGLKVVNIFSKQKPVVTDTIRQLAQKLEEKQLNEKIGLFRLDSNFQFQSAAAFEPNHPYLLFVHGTASSTHGSFGDLMGTETWSTIGQIYKNRVLAFQHASLTQSPIENVRDLIDALPDNITLDIISQSRGGIVAETAIRFCVSDENNMGFTKAEMEYFKKAYPAEYYEPFENMVNDIRKNVKKKRIKINKFIRVACPAHGTLLASSRLDTFFNLLFNLVGFLTGQISSPVYLAFKNLVSSVIGCKNDIHVLPGIEAMDPRSAYIKVLNSSSVISEPEIFTIDGSLTIISGNAKADLSLKGVLVIASKLFNMEKTDLIVNTESMYLGTKRLNKVQYFFDEGTNVTHFNYFKNDSTRGALLNALKTDVNLDIPGFIALNQQSILNGRNIPLMLGLEGGELFHNTATGDKPIVLLIPGIMGSNLSAGDDLIWIKYRRFLMGGLFKLDIDETDVKASSIVKTSYSKITNHLRNKYDVITFAFDWRLQLNETAELLKNKIEELQTYKQPIKVIAHSMGGVLFRDYIITQPESWKKLNASAGFRLLFLGAPLRGSYRIPSVLLGKDSIIDTLSKVDLVHTKKELLQKFFKFPGILSLLPMSVTDDFSDMKIWNDLTTTMDSNWPIPESSDLKTFKSYRDKALEEMKKIDYSNAVYIAGKDKSTPCGCSIEQAGDGGKEVVIWCTAEGDQSVTWESGIPEEMIKNKSVYYADVSHGSLANDVELFDAIDELLENKSTTLITQNRPEVRGFEKKFKQREYFDFNLSPENIENTLLGINSSKGKEVVGDLPIKVSVSLGDLKYSSYPLLAGHFKNESLINSEKRIDDILKGVLNRRVQLGLYPGDAGSSELFLTSNQDYKGAIIVGLGNHEDISSSSLTQTVELGVIKYLLHLNNDMLLKEQQENTSNEIGLSSLLIGIGNNDLSIEYSMNSILNGIQNANSKINAMFGRKVKNVKRLEFIEIYEDRAMECHYLLSKLEHNVNRSLNIVRDQNKLNPLPGAKKQFSIRSEEDFRSRIMIKKTAEKNGLMFTLSTAAAREEERTVYINPAMIEELFNEISIQQEWTPKVAKTIFELLIPVDLKDQLKNQANISLLLDKKTASYPWELLQDAVSNATPLCINTGMIRQLATADYRVKTDIVAGNNALIIGDPKLNGYLNQLPGAKREAEAVHQLLTDYGYNSTSKINSSSSEIIKAIFGSDIPNMILHLAGHGEFNPDPQKESGMVIGNGVFLSTKQISQMRSIQFAFINCCYLGAVDSTAEKFYRDRYKLAANIGTQLIENGVKAVIAAGWPIDDQAGNEFAMEFYTNMLKGDIFGTAVKKARKLIYEKYGSENNTWGAYQVYGDAYFQFPNAQETRKPKEYGFTMPEEAEIALFNLQGDIETNQFTYAENLERLEAISLAIEKADISNPGLIEKEALIYADLGQYDIAILKFQKLFENEKACFQVSSIEKYCNIQAKKVINDFNKKPSLRADFNTKMDEIIQQLMGLISVKDTSERYSLIGSAAKRKVKLTTGAEKKDSIKKAAEYYLLAHNKMNDGRNIYNILNWLELKTILWNMEETEPKKVSLNGNGALKGSKNGAAKSKNGATETIEDTKKEAIQKDIVIAGSLKYEVGSKQEAVIVLNYIVNSFYIPPTDKNFWNLVAKANIELCRMMIETGNNSWSPVYDAYRQVWEYAGARSKRIAEQEHLDILIDGLSINKGGNAMLINEIERLKSELEKMI